MDRQSKPCYSPNSHCTDTTNTLAKITKEPPKTAHNQPVDDCYEGTLDLLPNGPRAGAVGARFSP